MTKVLDTKLGFDEEDEEEQQNAFEEQQQGAAIVEAIQRQVDSDEKWEDRMAELERRDRAEARSHIERLLNFPNCAALALQCELERTRMRAQTLVIRRENRARLQAWKDHQLKVHRRKETVRSIARILSVTTIAITGVVLISSLVFEYRTYRNLRIAAVAPKKPLTNEVSVRTDVKETVVHPPPPPSPPVAPVVHAAPRDIPQTTVVPPPPPTLAPPPPPTMAPPPPKRPDPVPLTNKDDNVRYVIVRQKVETTHW